MKLLFSDKGRIVISVFVLLLCVHACVRTLVLFCSLALLKKIM